MTIDPTQLSSRLSDLAPKHKVPGATLALLVDGELVESACGVLNLDTGVPATSDSLFQIGSITKVEDVPSSVELWWRPGEHQAALTS